MLKILKKLFGKKDVTTKTSKDNDRFTLCVMYMIDNITHEVKLTEYKHELLQSGLDFRVEPDHSGYQSSICKKLCISVPKEDKQKLWNIHDKVYGEQK